MEEEKNIEQPTEPNTDPADTGEKGKKLFTQEEVNEIVRKRLDRVKVEPREPSEAEKREADLKARESRMACREYLDKFSYPKELADIIDTSNPEEFSRRADAANKLIQDMLNKKEDEMKAKRPRPYYPSFSNDPVYSEKKGFGSSKHIPKSWPAESEFD